CLASASPLAPMISPLGLCLYGVVERHPISIAQATTRRFPLDAEGELGDADVGHSWPCGRGYGRAAFGPPPALRACVPSLISHTLQSIAWAECLIQAVRRKPPGS